MLAGFALIMAILVGWAAVENSIKNNKRRHTNGGGLLIGAIALVVTIIGLAALGGA